MAVIRKARLGHRQWEGFKNPSGGYRPLQIWQPQISRVLSGPSKVGTEPSPPRRTLNHRLAVSEKRNDTSAAAGLDECTRTLRRTRRRGRRGGQSRGMTKRQQMSKKATRILAWNIRSHNQRRTTVDKLLEGNDVVMLQETKLRKKPEYDENTFHCVLHAIRGGRQS